MVRVPAILRRFWKTDVTILIPAYEAAEFIDRALRCSIGQTYDRVRVLVSVDKSTDNTVEVVKRFARDDRRIEIIEQKERRGWTGNVNVLLERADTEFFFVYFHDDFIVPQYCERLRDALVGKPDAASAYCDFATLGSKEVVRRAVTYDGSVARRILLLWSERSRGSQLRAMVRSSRVGPDYRLPEGRHDTFTLGEPLLMRLVAAGPSIGVPEVLYLRWGREGGLLGAWSNLPYEKVLAGLRAHVIRAADIVDETVPDEAERRLLKFVATLDALKRISGRCRKLGLPLPSLKDIYPAITEESLPAAIDAFGPDIASKVRSTEGRLDDLRRRLA